MPPILDPSVADYLKRVAHHGEPVLLEMEALARELDFPIIGPEVGRLLFQVARWTGAKRVFEMGSGYGYSTLWFARALPEDGRVFHTDSDIRNTERARDFLRRAGVENRVVFKTGLAGDVLQRTTGEFDVILIDVDKSQYPECYELARGRVRVGGAIITDNLLWDGEVADPQLTDPDVEGIREYTRRMWADPSFQSSLMPVRDGVGLSLRIG